MKNETQISLQANPNSFEIDAFIAHLKEQKIKGATNVRFYWSKDPQWGFEWVETFKIQTEKELKDKEIKDLEDRLEKLKK